MGDLRESEPATSLVQLTASHQAEVRSLSDGTAARQGQLLCLRTRQCHTRLPLLLLLIRLGTLKMILCVYVSGVGGALPLFFSSASL